MLYILRVRDCPDPKERTIYIDVTDKGRNVLPILDALLPTLAIVVACFAIFGFFLQAPAPGVRGLGENLSSRFITT